MQPHHMILFYVGDAVTSASFYGRILSTAPLEASPGFAMFKLNDATMLGLWNRDGVQPRPEVTGGASELGFHVRDRAAADELYRQWQEQGVAIAQAPATMDFGYTFTGVDPDGHRLRVFATP